MPFSNQIHSCSVKINESIIIKRVSWFFHYFTATFEDIPESETDPFEILWLEIFAIMRSADAMPPSEPCLIFQDIEAIIL